MRVIKDKTLFLILFIYQTVVLCQNGSGKFCIDAEPLCSGQFYYPNTSGVNIAETGPDYGCLISQLNPAWFYFQISNDGNLEFMIEQSTTVNGDPNLDTDFIVYGPFDDWATACVHDLTFSKIVDCSFSRDFVEFLSINNALAGSYYLLMIQNYSLSPGFVRVTQTAGSATTNCILAEDPIESSLNDCPGDVLSLEATTEGAVIYKWYEDDGFGNFVHIINNHSEILDVTTPNRYKAEAMNFANVVIGLYGFNVSFSDNSPLQISAEVITMTFIDENDIEVTVDNDTGDTYEYIMDGGAWQKEPIFKNVSLGYHEISVINSSGCRIGNTKITVMDYPLYFTPNGDGYHDTWNIPGMQNQSEALIYIFDRYGKLLKQLIPNGSGWDGTYNGAEMPTNDYWFTLTYIEPKDGAIKEFKSHFTLKR